jgi:uncharacterized membrane protein (TIGR01666 family)
MALQLRQIQQFIYGQAFADGLKATLAILVPALTGLYTQHLADGLTVALGAMCASLTDAPGPLRHKRNGILIATALAFVMAIITALVQSSFPMMLLTIAASTFFLSMFTVYGNRATAIGNTTILILILTMDKPIAPGTILLHAGLIAAGGLFYFFVSFFFYTIQPYKIAQRALGECLMEVANYLQVKASFYNTHTSLEEDYKKLISQQVVVHEKQDVVREIFFKTRKIVEESTDESRRLVYVFVQTVDLFEDITASYYHYASLRRQFADSGGLQLIYQSLTRIVNELHSIALSIQSGLPFRPAFDYDAEIKELKAGIDALNTEESPLILKRIVVNIRNLLTDVRNITSYFDKEQTLEKSGVDHSHFVTRQPLHPRILWNNLNLQSAVFRHSLRVCVACVAGYLISRFFPYGQHGYWILLTIAFILKPAFSLTKQRNIERIIGTAIGGVVGFLLLLLIPSSTALFVLMVLFMIGAYSTMRINYLAMVLCITPYVIILFSFLGTGTREVIQERMLDTLIGCGIAFPISYLLFPKWESEQIKVFMSEVLRANALYLKEIMRGLAGQPIELLAYKLARKNVYLHSANLSAAFQRMLSEPKSKQASVSSVQEFVVLNHLFFSNVAALATPLLSNRLNAMPAATMTQARKAYEKLGESLQLIDAAAAPLPDAVIEPATIVTEENPSLRQQLDFVYRLSVDIQKTSAVFSGAAATAPPVHSRLIPIR